MLNSTKKSTALPTQEMSYIKANSYKCSNKEINSQYTTENAKFIINSIIFYGQNVDLYKNIAKEYESQEINVEFKENEEEMLDYISQLNTFFN